MRSRVSRIGAIVAGAGLCAMLGGCASPLVGTWRATSMPAPDGRQIDSPDGAVTFAPDGTYTSYFEYSDQMLTDHGVWRRSGDELDLSTSEGHREYDIRIEGDELEMTEAFQGRRVTGTYRRVNP